LQAYINNSGNKIEQPKFFYKQLIYHLVQIAEFQELRLSVGILYFYNWGNTTRTLTVVAGNFNLRKILNLN